MNSLIVYLLSVAVMMFLFEIVPINLAHTNKPYRPYRITQLTFFVLLTICLLLRFAVLAVRKRGENTNIAKVREEQTKFETSNSPKTSGKVYTVNLMLSNFDRWQQSLVNSSNQIWLVNSQNKNALRN